ncbi:peptide chain release factor N(5)-glutamine methyltransferase [Robertkochia aurantiaca]|uniref:peptide chain release factor N(5)-glutamine methyltransferase n=1 Tax=Robertkochia aurantiaca TaxID=2873700 RepID=UPI001CCE88E5|nr:peptide chain release factor N(5)-glutamine methyltransferase [Robertkochia sp. 3YJGBD-33]
MTLGDLRKEFVDLLEPVYGQSEAISLFRITAGYLLHLKPYQLSLEHQRMLTQEQQNQFLDILDRLRDEEPVQYIFGKQEFLGMELQVTPDTLIPRPETEELVYWVIDQVKGTGTGSILDIGTGSGCIAIGLKKQLPGFGVTAIDRSSKALDIARMNARNQDVDVIFVQADILEATETDRELEKLSVQGFDVIVSNPPYVRDLEKQEIRKNVLEFEPDIALFVPDNDPLVFYRRILVMADKWLRSGGSIYFEINQYLGAEMTDLLHSFGYQEISLRQDLNANDRMIRGTKP